MRALVVLACVAASLPARADGTRERLRLSGGYRLTVPVDPAQIRHALFIEGALPLGGWLELTLATEMATEPTGVDAGGAATLLDVPLRLGARAHLVRGRVRFGGGALVSLHVLDATEIVYGAGRVDDVRVSVGLGADAVLQIALTSHVGIDVRVLAEALVPRQRFTVAGATALDVGPALFGAATGLVFSAP